MLGSVCKPATVQKQRQEEKQKKHDLGKAAKRAWNRAAKTEGQESWNPRTREPGKEGFRDTRPRKARNHGRHGFGSIELFRVITLS